MKVWGNLSFRYNENVNWINSTCLLFTILSGTTWCSPVILIINFNLRVLKRDAVFLGGSVKGLPFFNKRYTKGDPLVYMYFGADPPRTKLCRVPPPPRGSRLWQWTTLSLLLMAWNFHYCRRRTQVLMLSNSVTVISYEAWRTLFGLVNRAYWRTLERSWTQH